MHSAVVLSAADAARLASGAAASSGSRPQPYLIRAVFASERPTLMVRWSGADLVVTANGLGCAPLLRHPIMVLLDRAPRQVFVAASAAL